MSSEYKQLIDRLAKAMNFEGTYALITTTPEDAEIHLSVKGSEKDLAIGTNLLMETIVKNSDDKDASIAFLKVVKETADELEKELNSDTAAV